LIACCAAAWRIIKNNNKLATRPIEQAGVHCTVHVCTGEAVWRLQKAANQSKDVNYWERAPTI